jgi:hypothetical protein
VGLPPAVANVGVRGQKDSRTGFADDGGKFESMFVGIFESRVTPIKGSDYINAQNTGRILDLPGANISGSPGAHFSLRQYDNSALVAAFVQIDEHSAGTDFHVVRMSAN